MLSEFFCAISVVVFILAIVLECWKAYVTRTKLKAFYQVKGWPVIGCGLKILGKNNEQIFKLFKSNQLSYSWVGPVLTFHIDNPEDFQTILTSDVCLKKAFPYKFTHNRTGLVTSHPSIWKDHRRALNPTLGSKMVQSFLPIFNEKFKKMCDLLERKLDTNVDMHHVVFKATLDSGLSASFGLNWSMQNSCGDEIDNIVTDAMKSVQDRIEKCWFWWLPIYKLTSNYTKQMELLRKFYHFSRSALQVKRMELAEKLEHGEDELAIAKEENRQNFIQKCIQLELEQKWTMEEVYEEMDTIFLASIDTTAIVLNGVSIMLAIHQEYQERVVDEMREIFENVDETVTSEHLTRMTFLEIIIKEAMRHFPVVPFLGREAMTDFPINGGVIPKGSQIILDVLKMNKNPKYYGDNANEFYPERFLPENCANFHPYLFVPFSAGPRNCIGHRYAWPSMKIALSHILRRFKLTTDLKMKDIIIKPDLLLRIGNQNAIRIEKRQWHVKNKVI